MRVDDDEAARISQIHDAADRGAGVDLIDRCVDDPFDVTLVSASREGVYLYLFKDHKVKPR
jgi:hypothetical protein